MDYKDFVVAGAAALGGFAGAAVDGLGGFVAGLFVGAASPPSESPTPTACERWRRASANSKATGATDAPAFRDAFTAFAAILAQ